MNDRATLLTIDVEPDWGAAVAPDAPCEGIRRALPRLLDELARRDLRATFFVVGELAELFAEHVDPRAGHEVGAHALSHRRLSLLTPAERGREVSEARARLAAAGFAVDGFRAPFLDAPPDLHALLARAGYRYDASAGGLGPSPRNAARPPRAAHGSDDVASVNAAALRALWLPANLTWLRLLDPFGLALLPRRPAQLSLHLHELLPASRGLAGLPWPLARLHARGCGPRAWELLLAALDRAADDGAHFVTCRELLDARTLAVGAA
jgi:peptidoglycan/xylan/chitin deacetylase (PgdA/CDA1 family)